MGVAGDCFFCGRLVDEFQPWADLPPSHWYCRMAANMQAFGYDAFVIGPSEPE